MSQMETLLVIQAIAFAMVLSTLVAIVFHERVPRSGNSAANDRRDEIELSAIKGHLNDSRETSHLRSVK